MRESGWDSVVEVPYRAGDVSSLPGYVDVAALGEPFASDISLQKLNVIGTVSSDSKGPTLIINAHYDVDVVTTPHRWREPLFWRSARREGDRMYGRGATDMLGGLCVTLAAASVLANSRERWSGRIIFMAVTDEEVGGNGTLHGLKWLTESGTLLKEGSSNTECIIAEPSEGRVCLDSLGFIQFKITVGTASSHMGSSSSAASAYILGHKAVIAFDAALDAVLLGAGISDHRDRFVSNFGRIEAGEDASIPPANFLAEGVLFFPPIISRLKLEKDLSEKFYATAPRQACLEFGNFSLEGATFKGGRLIEIASERPGRSIHVEDALFRSPSDARLFYSYGIETVICGPGRLEQAHSIDEYVLISDLYDYFVDFIELAGRYLFKAI